MSQTNAETAKRVAAYKAVDSNVRSGHTVAIGSGTTIPYAVQRIKENNLDVGCVAITFQSKQLIREYGLRLTDLEETEELDVFIDGFDEVDVNSKTVIAGLCGAVTAVKITANASKQLLFIGDDSKRSQKLGQNCTQIPIEVIPMAYKCVIKQIECRLKGRPVLRMAKAKAGPVVTDHMNFIIDWKFSEEDIKPNEWQDIYNTIQMIPGVVTVGLVFNKGANLKVYLGSSDGTVEVI